MIPVPPLANEPIAMRRKIAPKAILTSGRLRNSRSMSLASHSRQLSHGRSARRLEPLANFPGGGWASPGWDRRP